MSDFRRRDVLHAAAGLTLRPAQRVHGAQGAARPNVVIVMTDQHRAGLTRRSGFPFDTMPALDRLAAGGTAFDRAYTTAPLCVPARVSLLTGRWPHAHRVRQNSAGKFAKFDRDLFQTLQEHGYRTGLAGKNHSHVTGDRLDFYRPYMHADGWTPTPAPKEFTAFTDWMKRLNHGVADAPTPFPMEAQYPHRIVSDAIEFVESSGQQPFALWVSFPEPHNPYQVPKPYFDMFPPEDLPEREVGPEALPGKGFKWEWLRQLEEKTYPGYDRNWRRLRSNYLGMLRLIDDQLDRLVKRLESSGVLRNTILVFLADHGDYFGDYGLMRKGVELPEALTRVPMIWAGWGVRRQEDPGVFVSLADVMPTLCEAVGATAPAGVQGRSIWPILQGEAYPREEFESIYAEVGYGGLHYGKGDPVPPNTGAIRGAPGAIPSFDELNSVTQSGNLKMVRLGNHKLTFDMMGAGQLYDLAADPYELTNLFNRPEAAAIQSRVMSELLRWTIRTEDDLPSAAYKAKTAERNWYRNGSKSR